MQVRDCVGFQPRHASSEYLFVLGIFSFKRALIVKKCLTGTPRRNPNHRALLVALSRQNLQQRRPRGEYEYLQQVRQRARVPSPPPLDEEARDDDENDGREDDE